jgi:hypothetical protein
MSVDLLELAFRKPPPSLTPPLALNQLSDLSDREPNFLKERGHREPLEHGRGIVATAPKPSLWPDKPHLLVVPQGGALEARCSSDLADAQKFPIAHLPPLT